MCTRLEIPVPPRGYWAKLAAGKPAFEIPLPSTDSKLPSEIHIATVRREGSDGLKPFVNHDQPE
jgi:hypothetical protein